MSDEGGTNLKVERDDELCTMCGACIPHCPSSALYIRDRRTMEVGFDRERCTGCGICVRICPYRAMFIR
ncbi:MAG: 4Fe-4S binding protein [Acidobacteria bacterium]|nr:4Fe-4S binding protein [Acidobacteriota bacterium]